MPGIMKALSEHQGKGLVALDEGAALLEACGLTADKAHIPTSGGALFRSMVDGVPLVAEVFKTEEKCQSVKDPRLSSTRPEVKTSLNVLVTVHVTFDRKRLTTPI